MIVACVLKTGGFKNRHDTVEYSPANVIWLKKMLEKHISVPFKFVCLSDVDIEGVETVKLIHNFPGWWSKIELFRHNLFNEPVFYIDLDTVIVKNIDNIVSFPHKFTVLRNISCPDSNRIGSGLMAWDMDLSIIYDKFLKDPKKIMEECTISSCWGDQGFIQTHTKNQGKFQDLFPNQVVSYKKDLKEGNPTKENKIIIFNGQPKPQDLKRSWIPC